MADADGLTEEQAQKRAEMDAMLGRFQEDQRPIHEKWQHLQSQIPRRLHHYTTIEGLEGIVTSGALWASDVRFMNDSSELTYAATLVEEVIEQAFAEVTDERLTELLPRYEGLANGFEYGSRPFIACFCESEDLLSQWRGYGSGQAPVALGLDLSMLAATGGLPPRTFLRKVVYNEQEQRAEVRAVVDTWLQTIRTLTNGEDGVALSQVLPYPGIWALQQALAEHHLCYKHPTFAEEQEWRLIKLVDVREEFRLLEDQRRAEMLAATRRRMAEIGVDMPEVSTDWAYANAEGVDIHFRRSSLGLVPYVNLHLSDTAGIFTGRLPLWRVIQGPSAIPELTRESLAMFLESKGYGFHTEVRVSGIPLRN